MAGETPVTIIGTLGGDPELSFLQSGKAVANVNIASTPRKFNRDSNEWVDGDTLWMRGSVWGDYAEHVVESLTKGDRVIVVGSLTQRSYETREGEKRTVVELQIDEIGPSLRWATAQPHKVTQGGGGQQRPAQQAQRPAQRQAAPAQYTDEPPF